MFKSIAMYNSITKEFLECSLRDKSLHGFLPIHKPRGVCCNKLLSAIKADINLTLTSNGIGYRRVPVYHARILEPYASGLVTFVLGHGNFKRRNFMFADYRYKSVIELGVERQYDCLDGQVINRLDIDHLNSQIIEETLSDFIGTIEQSREMIVRGRDSNLDELDESTLTVEDIYACIDVSHNIKTSNTPQKYPLVNRMRNAVCHDLKLLDYQKPFATIDITCEGTFSTRAFVRDIAKKLGTKASLVKLLRTQEGPILLDDIRVLPIHELHLEYYIHRLSALKNIYDSYMAQFDDKFEQVTYKPFM